MLCIEGVLAFFIDFYIVWASNGFPLKIGLANPRQADCPLPTHEIVTITPIFPKNLPFGRKNTQNWAKTSFFVLF